MPPHTFRLVLIVSCAHAMVHTFEHALPAVEQMIGEEFHVGKDETGALGTVWRLPFGLLAMLAGWLADRHGAKVMLIVYLLGCSAAALMSATAPSLALLFGWMFAMGCFASIYHPAGLSLISHETTAVNRGKALGWHGIFGSLGIAAAPFLAALVFSTGRVGWRAYYVMLTLPAVLIVLLLTRLNATDKAPRGSNGSLDSDSGDKQVDRVPWRAFLILVAAGSMGGFIYAAFMHFLPRYLSETGLRPSDWPDASFRTALATMVLVCGAVGQGIAGRMARPDRLKPQLVTILLMNAPFLLWMAFADGVWRFVAACGLAFVHFMHQPIYNSIVAHIVPRSRRSLGYGFSNMMTFGIGAIGPFVVGKLTDRVAYGSLAGVALGAAVVAACLTIEEAAYD
jgi:MFS family permease